MGKVISGYRFEREGPLDLTQKKLGLYGKY